MQLPARLFRRKAETHKRDYGHVIIVAGSRGFSGAGVLSAEAALRSGAGLVTLALPEGINNSVIKIKLKEVMTCPLPETQEGTIASCAFKEISALAQKAAVMVIGPGLTQNKETQRLIIRLIRELNADKVIDADGLNACKGKTRYLKREDRVATILTPHMGEMQRLTGISPKKLKLERKSIAQQFAKTYNVTVVLKGHNTLVVSPDRKTYINKTGNPGMATAGTGDVLAGIIAAFRGQGLDPFTAAKYAVYIHGLAGDLAAEEKTQPGLIASDISERIPEALKLSIRA